MVTMVIVVNLLLLMQHLHVIPLLPLALHLARPMTPPIPQEMLLMLVLKLMEQMMMVVVVKLDFMTRQIFMMTVLSPDVNLML